MSNRGMNLSRERRRSFRRNLKRYVYTQSFNRLSGRNAVQSRPSEHMAAIRVVFVAAFLAFFGIGIYFILA